MHLPTGNDNKRNMAPKMTQQETSTSDKSVKGETSAEIKLQDVSPERQQSGKSTLTATSNDPEIGPMDPLSRKAGNPLQRQGRDFIRWDPKSVDSQATFRYKYHAIATGPPMDYSNPDKPAFGRPQKETVKDDDREQKAKKWIRKRENQLMLSEMTEDMVSSSEEDDAVSGGSEDEDLSYVPGRSIMK